MTTAESISRLRDSGVFVIVMPLKRPSEAKGASETLTDADALATLLYYGVGVVLGNDGPATMSDQWRRASELIEEVLAGERAVQVWAADALDRGKAVPGHPDERRIFVHDFLGDELQRFLHGYEKLHADAKAYAERSPRPRAVFMRDADSALDPDLKERST